MLKKAFLFISLLCAAVLWGEEAPVLLKNMDFSEGLKYWIAEKNAAEYKNFAVIKEDDCHVLQISGGTKDTLQLVQTVNIAPADLLNKRINVFGEIYPEKIASGALNFMVREVDAAGKTIRYRKVKVDKWTPKKWMKYNISLVAKKPTARIQIYIQGSYLVPEDRILFKNLTLRITESGKR